MKDRSDLFDAADALLAFQGIVAPTRKQRVGAMFEAEFKIRVIKTLTGK